MIDKIFEDAARQRELQKKADKIKQIIENKVIGKIIPRHDEKGHHYEFVGLDVIRDSVTTILGIMAKPHLVAWAARRSVEFLKIDKRGEMLVNHPDAAIRESIAKQAAEAHIRAKEDAGDVGGLAHEVIENYIKEWIKTGTRPKDIRLLFKTAPGKIEGGFYLEQYNLSIIESDLRSVAAARSVEKLFQTIGNVTPIAAEILVGDPDISAGTLDFLCLLDGELAILDWKSSNQIDKRSYPLQVAAYRKFLQKMTGLKIKELKVIKISKELDKYEKWTVHNPDHAYKMFKILSKFYHEWFIINPDLLITKDKNIIKLS